MHDSATLAGATVGAGGSVTYRVYSDSGCTTLATTQISGQPAAVTVTNHLVPDSACDPGDAPRLEPVSAGAPLRPD